MFNLEANLLHNCTLKQEAWLRVVVADINVHCILLDLVGNVCPINQCGDDAASKCLDETTQDNFGGSLCQRKRLICLKGDTFAFGQTLYDMI